MKNDLKVLSYYSMRALFLGIGISKILSLTHEYIFISFLLGTLLGLLFLRISNNTNNKYINIISSLLIMVMSLIILINMISTMYLTNTPKIIIIIPFIILSLYITLSNKNTIYRVSNILIFFNIFIYIVAFFALIKYFRIDNFYYTNTSINNVLIASIQYALFSITPSLIIKSNNNYKTYIISSITLLFMCLLIYGILGHKMVEILRYPEYIVLKRVSLINSLKNIENIISFVWLIDLFMIYLTNSNNVLNIANTKILIIITILSIVISLLINNNYNLLITYYNYSEFIMLFILVLFLIPIKKTH